MAPAGKFSDGITGGAAGARCVLVTGGTGKLGRSLLSGFARSGYRVAFTARDAARAEPLRDECLALGAAAAHVVQADLSVAGEARRIVEVLRERDSLPDVLINNARNVEYLRVDEQGRVAAAGWHGEFTLGVVVAYELALEAAAAPDSPLRSIVNIASIYGVTAPNMRLYTDPLRHSPINYGVVKAALIHLTKELAVRLAPAVRVNAVSFGGVDGRVDDGFRARYSALCPSGRMLVDDEVFGPVRFLAESDSAGMTGHNMLVDGGWTVW